VRQGVHDTDGSVEYLLQSEVLTVC